jgi:exosortase C (VPDSG-CTERM-specific)
MLPRTKVFALLVALLLLCFAKPLYELAHFAMHSELFSYILLIPFISLYLVWLKSNQFVPTGQPVRSLAFLWFALGLAVLLAYRLAPRFGFAAFRIDSLSWTMLSFLLFFLGACFLCFDQENLRVLSFPLAFLIFIVPLPGFSVDWIEALLQQTSAVTAQTLFALTGMPVFRQGLLLQLPGIRLEVAPECSGIHSTLVLFITSLVAGELFLHASWKKVILAFVVLPLGIIRNAVRICTIGHLCVHVGPEMIDAPIHRRGGPLFFLISLVPLFLLLLFLRRSESTKPVPILQSPS